MIMLGKELVLKISRAPVCSSTILGRREGDDSAVEIRHGRRDIQGLS